MGNADEGGRELQCWDGDFSVQTDWNSECEQAGYTEPAGTGMVKVQFKLED